jgi:glycosyltransferase involved in cell wall biosynthesis
MSFLISIITATYNRRALLYDAIKSVLSQTYNNYEHIIVNDGGIDVSDIISKFNSDKIKYYNLEKNYGRSASRNFALKKAKGNIICYLDDDVTYLPNHLEIIAAFFKKHYDYSACFTDAYYIIEKIKDGKREILYKKKFFDFSHGIDFNSLYVSNFIDLNSFAHRKNVINIVGSFNTNLNAFVDWEFILRIFKYFKIYHIPKITNEYRIRLEADNISHPAVSIKKAIYNYKKVYRLHPPINKKILNERKNKLKEIRLIKQKIRYLNHRISSLKPDYIILCRFFNGMNYFNPITFNLKKKVNFILDEKLRKERDNLLGIPIVSLKEIKEKIRNKQVLFILYEYIDINIDFAKKKLLKNLGKNIKISHSAYKIIQTNVSLRDNLKKLKKVKYIAIFGLGKSGIMTYEYIKDCYPEKIKYFIDDNVKEDYEGIPIVTTDDFLKNHQNEVDCVIFGFYQALNPNLIPNLKIPYLRLEHIR